MGLIRRTCASASLTFWNAGLVGGLFALLGMSGALLAPMPAMAQTTSTRPDPSTAETTGFAQLVARLSPTVVNISAQSDIGFNREAGRGSEFLDQLLSDRRDLDALRRERDLGSGFVVGAEGLIVTNRLIVDGADGVDVTLIDGTVLPADLVGVDEESDVALLKVAPPTPLRPVRFANSERVRVGDWVLAIGNPFGLAGSVTAGIVSATGRGLDPDRSARFLQTDAAINQGNSGGPLFNTEGDVIGLSVALSGPGGPAMGIGFAIPANDVKAAVDRLQGNAKVAGASASTESDGSGEAAAPWAAQAPWGMSLAAPSASIRRSFNVPDRIVGVVVTAVDPDSMAAKKDMRTGDVIVQAGQRPVRTGAELASQAQTARHAGRRSIALLVVRGGETQFVSLPLGP